MQASKGNGRGCKGKGKDRVIQPRRWEDFSVSEQWWLGQLWSGELDRRREVAEGQMTGVPVRAPPFRM